MYEQSISPCAYPGCRDLDGNPRLTREVICDYSRRHYWMVLDRVAFHYAVIRVTLPAPVPPPGERVMRVVAKEYGHPAEWASDMAREIADLFNSSHDELADHLQHEPPAHPQSREAGRVSAGHHYLTSWFNDLCTFWAAKPIAESFHDLDRQLRRGLGKTDPRRFLPVPCPKCDILGLVRTIDPDSGDDHVDCHSCGEQIPHQLYGHWTRVLLDELIQQEPDHEDEESDGSREEPNGDTSAA